MQSRIVLRSISKRSFSTAPVASQTSSLEQDLSQRKLALESLGGRSSVSGLRAAVFGATGLLGPSVVNQLGKNGSQVVIPYRGDGMYVRRLKLMGDLGQILPQQFHLRDMDSLKRVCEGSDIVVNCLGRDWETKNFTFHDVHVHGTRAIATAAKEQGAKRFIHVSALGAEEKSESRYMASKWESEQVAKEIFPDATIIRPCKMFGNNDRFIWKIAKFADASDKFPLLHLGETKFSPVDARDVAIAISTCLKNPLTTAGQTYELVGPETHTFREIVSKVQYGIGVGQRTREVSESTALAFSAFMAYFPWDKALPITQDEVKQFRFDHIKNPDTLGFEDLALEARGLEDSMYSIVDSIAGTMVHRPSRSVSDSAIALHG